jgi:hypothetical protein
VNNLACARIGQSTSTGEPQPDDQAPEEQHSEELLPEQRPERRSRGTL